MNTEYIFSREFQMLPMTIVELTLVVAVENLQRI